MFDTFNYYLLVIILGSSKFRELQMTLFQDCDIFSLHVGIKVRVATILDSSAHPRESGERLTQPLQYLLAHPLRHLKKGQQKILQWRNIIPAAQRNFLNSNLSILVCFVFAFRAASSICIPIFCWVNLVFF